MHVKSKKQENKCVAGTWCDDMVRVAVFENEGDCVEWDKRIC